MPTINTPTLGTAYRRCPPRGRFLPWGGPAAKNTLTLGRKTRQEDEAGHIQSKLPHEHDESHESQSSPPRPVIKQAYDDVQSGKEDTDLRSTQGRRINSVPKNER